MWCAGMAKPLRAFSGRAGACTAGFDDAVFNAVAESLKNPDWPNMTLHSYRVRWGEAEPDPYYAELEKRQKSTFPLRRS